MDGLACASSFLAGNSDGGGFGCKEDSQGSIQRNGVVVGVPKGDVLDTNWMGFAAAAAAIGCAFANAKQIIESNENEVSLGLDGVGVGTCGCGEGLGDQVMS